jgi:hypothetical protein
MENAGEELAGNYLRWVLDCDFVEYNLNTKAVQGEIDVVGVNLGKKLVYVCEVATHLETGLQYTKNAQPDNVDRFLKKFEKDIKYANEFFRDYTKIFMLWSPIVKDTKEGSKHNQMRDLKEIQNNLNEKFQVNLELIINEKFMNCLQELRDVAREKTQAMPTTVMRFLQIDEKTKAHVKKITKEN